MKLRFERIGRDLHGNPKLPELRGGTLRTAVLNVIKILEDNPNKGVTGYHSMTQLQATIMVEYWKRYDGMPEYMTQEQFTVWFILKATFPDIIRRACQWLHAQRLVEIDPAVEADAAAMSKAIQSQMAVSGQGGDK